MYFLTILIFSGNTAYARVQIPEKKVELPSDIHVNLQTEDRGKPEHSRLRILSATWVLQAPRRSGEQHRDRWPNYRTCVESVLRYVAETPKIFETVMREPLLQNAVDISVMPSRQCGPESKGTLEKCEGEPKPVCYQDRRRSI